MSAVTLKVLDKVLDNKVIVLVVSSLVLFNIIHSLDSLPDKVKTILLHPASKVVSIFVSVFYVTRDIKIALISTLVLVALYNAIFFIKENFEIITKNTDVYPGCVNVKVTDLLALFNNDEGALRRAMYELSIPLNIELNDDNAPLISTYLINHGKKISESCKSPM